MKDETLQRLDPATARSWLDLELDGELSPVDQSRLRRALDADPELAEERRQLQRMNTLLAEDTVPVRDGFKNEILKSLPPTAWQGRHPRSWRLAAGLLLALGAISAALIGSGSAELAPAAPAWSALAAVGDLFQAALLTGGGFAAASWKGLGLALGKALSGSPGSLAAFGLLVLSVNATLWILIRGRRRGKAAEAASSGAED